MQPFEYAQPTQVICETGAGVRAGAFASVLGRRVLVVTGEKSARASGALGHVEESLQAHDLPYELFEGVPPNPAVSVVDAGAAFARSVHTDVIIAVGGGSVIDAAKAIATVAVSHLSYRNYLSGIRTEQVYIESTLPVIAIPTLPGSGSETNGTSVIVDDITGRKLSAHSELAAPRVALLDALYPARAPRRLLALGYADALCHAIEAGLSQRASIASDALAEVSISMLRRCASTAIRRDLDAVATCMWASNLAGQALSLAGSILTHPLAHPLSARCGAHHGATVAALEPVVLAALADSWGDSAPKLAGWFGSRATNPAAAMRAVLTRLAAFNKALGITATTRELGLAEDMIDTFVADARASGSRGLANTAGRPLSHAAMAEIYERSLDANPSVAQRRLPGPVAAG